MKRLCAAKQSRLSNPPTENACSKRSPRSPPLFCGPRSQHQEDKRTTRTDRGGKERNAENTLARARYPPPRRAKNCRRRKRTEWVSVRFFSERTKKRMAHVVWGKRVGTRKTQQQESPCWCARDRQKGKKKVGGCRVPAKKKKKRKQQKKNRGARIPVLLFAPRVFPIILLKGRLRQSTVGASPAAAQRRNARSLKHPRAPVVNTLSVDDSALVVSRGLALVKRESRAVHAVAGQRREHQPHVRIHVHSLEVVSRNLLPERHELVLVLPRVADELRAALRRSPTLGHQVVPEVRVQPGLASRTLVDVDVDVAHLYRRVVRAPEPHERTRRDVPWRDVGGVQDLGLGDVEEPRTSGFRVDPSRHVVGHLPAPERDQRSAAHRCRAARVRRPEHAPTGVLRVLSQRRLQGRRVLSLRSCDECREDHGCDGLHYCFFFFFVFLFFLHERGLRAKPVLRRKA